MALVNFPTLAIPLFDKDGVPALGKVYIGDPFVDPKTNPKDATIFKADDNTQVPAAYPIILSAGGVLQLNGSPVTVDVDGEYSLRIDDKNDNQIYLFTSLGTPTDTTQSILNALALDLNYSTDTIGTIIITSAVGNLLDEAEYILDLNTDLVWSIPIGITNGSQVTNLNGTGLLTTTNGTFQLKPKQADITQSVENLIKGNQNWNVAGVDGSLISSPQSFVAGDEFTFGWKVSNGSSLTDIVRINGETTAPSGGIVHYVYTQDEAGNINEDDTLFSVTNKAGLQTYSEGLTVNGLEIDSTTVAGEVKLSIDFSVYTDGFAFFGVSNKRGQIQPINDIDSTHAALPNLLEARQWFDVKGSRSIGVQYTNDTETDMILNISTTAGTDPIINIFIGGEANDLNGWNADVSGLGGIYQVPKGSTYIVTEALPGLSAWKEFRTHL